MSALRKIAPLTWDEIYAQDKATPSPAHALITANIIVALGMRLKGRPCYPTSSDQRVKLEAAEDGVYPDVTVICPPATFDSDGRTILNPSVIFEVLSSSTAESDLTDKSDIYFQIPSIQNFILVSQNAMRVEVRRRGAQSWQVTILRLPTEEISLPEIGVTLPLSEIYERLELPAPMRIIERNGTSA